jgi:hypothetical protein
VEKMLTMAELGKVIFLGCTHSNIWVLNTQEEAWAKKASLMSLKKFNWTHINEPFMKELICNFNYNN